MKRFAQTLLICLVSLIILGFVANLLIDNPYTHRIARVAINERLERYTNIDLDFKAVKVSVMPPGIELYGVSVATKEDTKRPLVATSKIAARLSLWSLFFGELKLGTIEATDLKGQWPPPWGFQGFLKEGVADPAGESELAVWPPDLDLPVETIRLRNAHVYAEFPIENQPPLMPEYLITSAAGLDVELALSDIDDIRLRVQASQFNVAEDESSWVEDAALDLIGELRDGRLTLSRLMVEGDRIKVQATGLGQITTGPKNQLKAFNFDGDLTYDTNLSVLGSFLEIAETRGPVSGQGTMDLDIPMAEGNNDPVHFALKGNAKVQNGMIDGFSLYNSAGEFTVSADDIRFDQIRVIVGETETATATGSIGFDDPIPILFDVNPQNLRLADLLNAFDVNFDLFDFIADSDLIQVRGVGEPFRMDVAGNLKIRNIELPSAPIAKTDFLESPNCTGELQLFATSKLLDFKKSQLTCTPAVAGDGAISPPTPTRLAIRNRLFFDEQKGINLQINSDRFGLELGQYFGQIPLSGTGPLQINVAGPYADVLVDLRYAFQDVRVARVGLGGVTGTAQVREREIFWRNLQANLPGGGALRSRTGQLTARYPYPIDASLSGEKIDTATVTRLIDVIRQDFGLSFQADAITAELKGPLLYPLAMTGRLDLIAKDGVYTTEKFFDKGRLKASATPKGWQVEQATAELGFLALKADLVHSRAEPFSEPPEELRDADALDFWQNLGWTDSDNLRINITSADPGGDSTANVAGIDHLGILPFVGSTIRTAQLVSPLSLQVLLEGTTSKLTGTLNGALTKPTILGSGIAPVQFQGFVDGGTVNLVLNHSGTAFEGRLNLDILDEGFPYEWYFGFKRFDFRAFATQVFALDARNYAYLTGTWQMQGQLLDWWRSKGQLSIEEININYVREIDGYTKQLRIGQASPVTIQLAQDGWDYAPGSNPLTVSGSNVKAKVLLENNRPPENLNLKIEAVGDMELVKEFSSSVESATGQVVAIGSITGDVKSPNFEMQVADLKPNPFNSGDWAPVSLGLADVRPSFRNMKFKLRYFNGKFFVDSFSADKGGGRITASGVLHMLENSPEESLLNIALSDAVVAYPLPVVKNMNATVDGNISVSGTSFPLRVSGDIVVSRARATREVDIKDEIINAIQSQSIQITTVDQKPYFIFDLNLLADNSISIQNQTVQAVMSTNLQIQGSEVEPQILGQLEIDRGKLIYKHDFTVTRGLINFDDPVKIDPNLDVLAEAKVQTYNVYVAISGRASDPKFDLSIDPPTRQDGTPISKVDIIVLLNRGSLPDTSRAVGESQQTAASEGINLLFGLIDEPFENILDLEGQTLVRDPYIDFYPSEEGPLPRINLPLDLGQDFDFIVRFGQTTGSLTGEYDLNESISLTGSIEQQRDSDQNATTDSANQADAAVDVKFGFSFD